MRKVPENSTPIINEIIEKLAYARLSCYEFNIIFALIRKTYGWEKKEDWISGSQFSDLTKIPTPHVYRTIKKLLQKKIIKKSGNIYGLNKNSDEWVIPEQVLKNTQMGIKRDLKNVYPNRYLDIPKQVSQDTQTGMSKIPKQVYTKETITKETITKDTFTKESGEKTGFSPTPETPKKIMQEFLKMFELKNSGYEQFILKIVEEKKLDKKIVEDEIEKFVNKWAEKTRDGKRQLWEVQKSFELGRRLGTWWKNYFAWHPQKKNSPAFRIIS